MSNMQLVGRVWPIEPLYPAHWTTNRPAEIEGEGAWGGSSLSRTWRLAAEGQAIACHPPAGSPVTAATFLPFRCGPCAGAATTAQDMRWWQLQLWNGACGRGWSCHRVLQVGARAAAAASSCPGLDLVCKELCGLDLAWGTRWVLTPWV